jgi:hypothetical protein
MQPPQLTHPSLQSAINDAMVSFIVPYFYFNICVEKNKNKN